MGFFDNDPGVPPGVELETAPDEEAPALRRTEPALSEGEKRGGPRCMWPFEAIMTLLLWCVLLISFLTLGTDDGAVEINPWSATPIRVITAMGGCVFLLMAKATRYNTKCRLVLYVVLYSLVGLGMVVCTALDAIDYQKFMQDANKLPEFGSVQDQALNFYHECHVYNKTVRRSYDLELPIALLQVATPTVDVHAVEKPYLGRRLLTDAPTTSVPTTQTPTTVEPTGAPTTSVSTGTPTGTPTTVTPTTPGPSNTPSTAAPIDRPTTGTPTTLGPSDAPTTPAPTGAPTTPAPTGAPTRIPTEAIPTATPSFVPSVSPTDAPTNVPTISPTHRPTESPTLPSTCSVAPMYLAVVVLDGFALASIFSTVLALVAGWNCCPARHLGVEVSLSPTEQDAKRKWQQASRCVWPFEATQTVLIWGVLLVSFLTLADSTAGSIETNPWAVTPVRIIAAGTGCLFGVMARATGYQSTCRIMLYVSVYCCVAICLIVCTALDVKDHTKLVSDAAEGQELPVYHECHTDPDTQSKTCTISPIYAAVPVLEALAAACFLTTSCLITCCMKRALATQRFASTYQETNTTSGDTPRATHNRRVEGLSETTQQRLKERAAKTVSDYSGYSDKTRARMEAAIKKREMA